MRQHDQVGSSARERDAQQAGGLITQFVDTADGRREGGEPESRIAQEALANLGHTDPPRRAIEQMHPQLRFQRAQVLRQSRGRHAQLFSRAREAGMVGHSLERSDQR